MAIFLIDFAVNVFETIAGFILMLSIYLFPIRSYTPQIVFTSIVMAQTSYLLREVFLLDWLTPFFMLLWMVLLLWLLFRIHLFYALLMAVSGYLVYIVLQMLIVLILQAVSPLTEIQETFQYLKLVQLLASLAALAISRVLIKKRLGFSFVPDRISESVPVRGTNRKLLITLIVASIWISVMVSVLSRGMGAFVGALISISLIAAMIIHLMVIKERSV
ncbi:hypothetical protein [Paenibacillus daejeonensis]|uniref:hypothetical protein n=1 Tax=Paenibacillus daejeonensis TaxID=135193 RepID=UPI00036F4773|nr:hypothetical protein [Paenibacillus daejeonensis]